MIELTEQQVSELGAVGSGPAPVVNPLTKELFVLLWVEEYERLKGDDYDDSPWTREELEALARKAGQGIGWNDMDEYNQLQTSHAYVATTLPLVLREAAIARNATGPQARKVLSHARHLAREIELLAPAVKRGGQRPDNCEYPWEDAAGALYTPLDWTFSPASLLVAPTGRTLLKLLRVAIDRLLS